MTTQSIELTVAMESFTLSAVIQIRKTYNHGGCSMSRKTAIILSVILFIILCALIVCEKKWPTAGCELLGMSTFM